MVVDLRKMQENQLVSEIHIDKLEFVEVVYLKRVIAIGLCLVMIWGLVACSSRTIGSVGGAENEYITIDGAKYVLDTANSFSSADKGKYLGKVSNSALTMKVYSVKEDTEDKYIYALWDWEGVFYIRQE